MDASSERGSMRESISARASARARRASATMMMMMFRRSGTVEARGRERARVPSRGDVRNRAARRASSRRRRRRCSMTVRCGARRGGSRRGARARVVGARGRAAGGGGRGREVTIDVPAVMRGKGFVLYASEGKLMKIGRERGLAGGVGVEIPSSIAPVGECPMSRTCDVDAVER